MSFSVLFGFNNGQINLDAQRLLMLVKATYTITVAHI